MKYKGYLIERRDSRRTGSKMHYVCMKESTGKYMKCNGAPRAFLMKLEAMAWIDRITDSKK